MSKSVFTALIIISGILTIRAEYLGPRGQVYLFKPLTIILILLMAISLGKSGASAYKAAIYAGLVFSLAGDVFLMHPEDRFIAGLASFLVAQVLYIVAFTAGRGFSFSPAILVPFILYGGLMYMVLSPHLGEMRLPVAAYVVVILVMVWQAWERRAEVGDRAALLAALGATLFVLSDSILALDKFRGEFGSARALTLSTYYAAQWLIASSMG